MDWMVDTSFYFLLMTCLILLQKKNSCGTQSFHGYHQRFINSVYSKESLEFWAQVLQKLLLKSIQWKVFAKTVWANSVITKSIA